MRHRLGVYRLLCSLALPTLASSAAAQAVKPTTLPPTAAPPASAPTAAPPAAAPVPSPTQAATAAQPAAAPALPPTAAAPPAESNPESFNLAEALRGGQPMTSAEAAQRASKTAPSVEKVEAAARRAEAAAEQANVALYPRVELEARYTRVSAVDSPAFFTQLGTVFQAIGMATNTQLPAAQPLLFQKNQGLFQARVTWPVSTMFFTMIPRHKAAMEAAEAQKLQSRVERQTVGVRTREAYYNYARARAALMVAKATLAQTEAHRRDSDALVSAGSIARVELMRAEAQVAAAKVAQARADNSVAVGRSALYTLVHVDGTQDITISENLEEELPQVAEDENTVLARALERRSELKALRTMSDSQGHSIDALQGAQLPVLAIGGTAEQGNPNQRWFGSYEEWKGSWAAYASLVWSPNDTFSAGKQVDAARAELASTLADLQSLKDALRVEVSQAYNGYSSAHVALDAARSGIAAAEESYRVRREQFRAGAAIAVDVIDSEAQLRQARLDLVNTLIDLRIAKARLDRAVEAD
jgi:outer membrane protein TolC